MCYVPKTQKLPTLVATQRLANELAELVQPPLTIALVGTLGAGKTQWVRYLVAALGGVAEQVTSPTYVLMQSYTGRLKIHHFDFYRLNSAAEVWDLGIDELFEQPCVVVIEWADRFPECLPEDCLKLVFTQTENCERAVEISASGSRSRQVVAGLS